MKLSTIFVALLVLLLASCNTARNNNDKAPETPKALEDKSAYVDVSYKRNGDNLLEGLYQELASKNTDLQALDKAIDDLNKQKFDSSRLFNIFNSKNENYYNVADGILLAGIKDSLLRNKMRLLIASSLQKYKASTSSHTALLSTIDSGVIKLNDLYTALKIIKTLPIIEDYQRQHLPNTKSLEGYLQKQKNVIKQADDNLKKN